MLKHKRLIAIIVLLILLTCASAIFLPSRYVIPILTYHLINPDAEKYGLLAVTPDTFERQMRFLKQHRYNVIPLGEAVSYIREKKRPPARTLAISIDDGFKDNYFYAFPILKKYNFPAEIFLIVNEIGNSSDMMLSWEQILEMQASGLITFGSHTLNHPNLSQLTSQDSLKDEIYNSKKILEDKLGHSVDGFCYPGGAFNDKARSTVIDSGYKFAMVNNPGKRFPNSDPFAVKRLRISRNCGNLFIFWVETSGYYNFMRELNHR